MICSHCRAEQESNSAHPNWKTIVKEKYFRTHDITSFFFPFIFYIQLDSDIIVNKDQYIFIIILRYLLYFSEYLHLYKQSTHFKVHIFNTVLTRFAITRFLSRPPPPPRTKKPPTKNLKLLNKKPKERPKIFRTFYTKQKTKSRKRKETLLDLYSLSLAVRLVTSGVTKYFHISRFVNILGIFSEKK